MVYGGSRFGCLGKMADAVVAGGGKLTGILPPFFTSELKQMPCVVAATASLSPPPEMEGYSIAGEEHVVPDMHTRKKMLFDKVSPSQLLEMNLLPSMSQYLYG